MNMQGSGETVKIEPKDIEIYEIQLLKIEEKDLQIQFIVHCSKGTYIRSLCDDIAKRLGTIGYMTKLNRIQVGKFNIKDAILLENVKENNIIPIEEIFKNKPSIELTNKKLELFLNGVNLSKVDNDGVYKIYSNKKFIGTGVIKNNLLKRDIVI